MVAKKKKLGVWKFASCDGCQLTLLSCEDELLTIAEHLDIAYFKEATRRDDAGPFDLGLVEGSITTAHDAERIRQVRNQCRHLVVIGACATSGGIQALRNLRDIDQLVSAVYANPQYIDTLATSTPIADHVHVDFELRGCPINKQQLIEVISAYLNGRKPRISSDSVCVECKRRGAVCVMVTRNEPCLGPVTHAGCDALCPTYGRACYGCYGPKQRPNVSALTTRFSAGGQTDKDIILSLRTITPAAPAFHDESTRYEQDA
jgi:coenzyme F420-reducing hydrogenase gamma subunit